MKVFCLLSLFLFLNPVYSSPFDPYWYRIKKHDTVANVIRGIRAHPIWGKKGNLQRILQMNPTLRDHGNYVQVGEVILLPHVNLEAYPDVEIASDGELNFKLPLFYYRTKKDLVAEYVESLLAIRQPASVSPEVALETGVIPQNAVATESDVSSVSEPGYSVLTLTPYSSFTQLNATQTGSAARASLPSTLTPGVRVKWTKVFGTDDDSDISTSVLVGIQRFSLREAPNKTFATSSANLSEIGFSVSKGLPPFKGELFVEYMEHPFLRAVTGSQITMDVLPQPVVGLMVSSELLTVGKLSETLQLGGSLLLPGRTEGLESKLGSRYEFGLLSEQDMKKFRFFNRVYYRYSSQQTNVTNQINSDFGVELGVSMRLGE